MGDAGAYLDKPDDDALPVPDWFAAIRFASWNCTQIGEPTSRHDNRPKEPLEMPNNVYLVFSEKPATSPTTTTTRGTSTTPRRTSRARAS